jgi:endonuclease VIII
MPEGHTIHRLARDLTRDLRGATVEASSPQGRFALGAAQIDGLTLRRAEAYGKQLFLDWSSGAVLSVHLGLIGKFRPHHRATPPSPQTRLRLQCATGTRAWDLTGPMACGLIDPAERARLVAGIGPDPLRRDGSPELFIERCTRRRGPIGAVLLDQRVVAGLGNVYRAELCFLCGIDPHRDISRTAPGELRRLWDEAVHQLRNGVRHNRIVTRARDELGRTVLAQLPAEERLYVYKRHGLGCHRCGEPIDTATIGGRPMSWCAGCQR